MSDEQLNKKIIDVEVPRRTLKDAVAQGLEEKGAGKDMWLWWVCLEYFISIVRYRGWRRQEFSRQTPAQYSASLIFSFRSTEPMMLWNKQKRKFPSSRSFFSLLARKFVAEGGWHADTLWENYYEKIILEKNDSL